MPLRDAGSVADLGGAAYETLRSAALGPHSRLEEQLTAAGQAVPSQREPRRARELADTFMATTSRHLAAVDDTLLPVADVRLEGGHDLVAAYVAQSRELEQALHAVKAWMYGDANARGLDGDALWAEVGRLLADHEARETVLVDGLATWLTEEDLTGLAERLRRSEEHAPTRPHPYTPHTGVLGRIVHRAWSVCDSFWDSAEGRVIPHRDRPPHPRRDSLVTRYVLGAPRFDEPVSPQERRTTPGSEAAGDEDRP
jgi:hypothetical protein